MNDKPIGQAAGSRTIGIIKSPAVNCGNRIILLCNAARRIPFFLNIFSRCHLYPLRIGDFQKITHETGRFNLLQRQRGIGTRFKGKNLRLFRRFDYTQYFI